MSNTTFTNLKLQDWKQFAELDIVFLPEQLNFDELRSELKTIGLEELVPQAMKKIIEKQ